jgi:hypothetical protein
MGFFYNLTLLLRSKQSLENFHIVALTEEIIHFMIMKEYLFLHQLTVLHLTMIIICIICIIHHYIQFVLVINILLNLSIL